MESQNSSIEKTNVSQVGYADTAFRRDKAYQRGYVQGQECVAEVKFPAYPQDIIAFVQGFITGTYDRIHYNSGDYLTF